MFCTVRCFCLQISSTLSQLPRVSYIKLIDVWLTVCLSFVFAAFLEYALVNKLALMEKRAQMKNKDKENNKRNTQNMDTSFMVSHGGMSRRIISYRSCNPTIH
mgnify:FL=1